MSATRMAEGQGSIHFDYNSFGFLCVCEKLNDAIHNCETLVQIDRSNKIFLFTFLFLSL